MFLRNLTYWTKHVTLCSAPSFFLACLGGYGQLPGVMGMLTGILLFILGYTALSCSPAYQRAKKGILGDAVPLAMKVRAWISVVSIICVGFVFTGMGFIIFILPDYWAGLAAIDFMQWCGRQDILVDAREPFMGEGASPWIGHMESFFPTLGTVLVEGVILSAFLFLLCLITLSYVRSKEVSCTR